MLQRMEKDESKEGRSATGRDSEKYILRFPDGMRARLHEAARANSRTLNAEIVARLQASFFESQLHASAKQQLRDLQHELAKAQMATIQERNRVFSANVALVRIARLLDVNVLKKHAPDLARLVKEAQDQDFDLMKAGLRQMLDDAHAAMKILDEGIETGRIKIVNQPGAEAPLDLVDMGAEPVDLPGQKPMVQELDEEVTRRRKRGSETTGAKVAAAARAAAKKRGR